jgi:hypothetical protein
MAQRLGQILLGEGAACLPDMTAVRHVFRLAWSAAAGDLALQTSAASCPERLRAGVVEQGTTLPKELAAVARNTQQPLVRGLYCAVFHLVRNRVAEPEPEPTEPY